MKQSSHFESTATIIHGGTLEVAVFETALLLVFGHGHMWDLVWHVTAAQLSIENPMQIQRNDKYRHQHHNLLNGARAKRS